MYSSSGSTSGVGHDAKDIKVLCYEVGHTAGTSTQHIKPCIDLYQFTSVPGHMFSPLRAGVNGATDKSTTRGDHFCAHW